MAPMMLPWNADFRGTSPWGMIFNEGVDDEEVGHQAEDEGHGDRYRTDSRYVIEP